MKAKKVQTTKPKTSRIGEQVRWRDIFFWAGAGLLGMYTFREASSGQAPPQLKRRQVISRAGETKQGEAGAQRVGSLKGEARG